MNEEQENEDQIVEEQTESETPVEKETAKQELVAEETTEATAGADENGLAISALAAEVALLKDRLLRMAAEYDNYRKRSDREMQNYISNANADLLAKLLPALDDFDRIITASENGAEPGTLLDGIKLLQKNVLKVFQDAGLQLMQTVAQEFDPMLHDALLHVAVEGQEPNRVVEEHRKGYLYKDRVLRHAQVVVSK